MLIILTRADCDDLLFRFRIKYQNMSIEDKKEFDEDIEPVLSLDKHLGLDYAEYSSIMNKLKKLEK